MKYWNIFIVIFILMMSLFSCNPIPDDVKQVLETAGENRKELQAVLDYYQAPKDSLKLKAAYFLIANMSNKYFYPYSSAQKELITFIKLLKKENRYDKNIDSIAPFWERLKQKGMDRPNPIKDVNFITSKMLIENIEYAFKVWNSVPWSKKYSFEQFCEYILPYRSSDIPSFWRKKMFEKFRWAIDSVKDNDFIKVSAILNDSLHYTWNKIFREFPNMNVMDMDTIRTFGCSQHSDLRIAALRSIGIPIAEVSGLNGTYWVIVPDKKGKFWGWHDNNPPKVGAPYIDEQRFSDYAKIFKSTFKIQPFPFKGVSESDIPSLFFYRGIKDVTKDHSDAMDVSLTLSIAPPKETKYVYLCYFNDRLKSWDAAHWGEIVNNRVTFDQMGLGCFYIPMYYSNGTYYPAGIPIYLNKNKTITTFKPTINRTEPVKLFRKAPLNYYENRNSEMIMTDVFEGSNNKDFTNATPIYTIYAKAYFFEEKKSMTDKKFRYVRYRSVPIQLKWQDSITHNKHFPELAFLGKNDQELKGKLIANSVQNLKNCNIAFDNNIYTNFEGVYPCWIGFDFGKPTQVTKVKYMFRSSFNTVEPGDQYELLYWDNEWKSLGKQLAVKNYVIFNAPKNSILWLQNITKGNAETIFFMKDGKQIWCEGSVN